MIYLLLEMISESIEFFQKGLLRPAVFIKKVFRGREFKLFIDPCVNLMSANLGSCYWDCLCKQLRLNLKFKGFSKLDGNLSSNF